MKGIILNLLELFIVQELGEVEYKKISKTCLNKEAPLFLQHATYMDDDFNNILIKTAEELDVQLEDVLRKFGRFCFPILAKKFPDFVNSFHHPKDFLKTVETTVHKEVEKRYKEAKTPDLVCCESGADQLTIEYISKRGLCKFMEGLIDGVGDYYGTCIQHRQMQCKLRGDDTCKFDLKFKR